MSRMFLHVITLGVIAANLTGCVSVVGGNERGLMYKASGQTQKSAYGPGWYFRMPWTRIVKYDMRWKRYEEQIDVRTKDGLHVKATIAIGVRPQAGELYALDSSAGPDFYEQIVKPALFASARDSSGEFNHLEAATHTHDVETKIKNQLLKRVAGQSIEIGEVAIQHFDLPEAVQAAADRTAAASQLLGAKQVDLDLAQKEADLVKTQRRGKMEADGLERQLKAEQDLAAAEQQFKVREAQRRVEVRQQEAEAEAIVVRAEADAKATIIKAEADSKAALLAAQAEKQRIAATSTKLTPNFLRLRAIDALAAAMSGPNTKILVVPTGKNGLPSFFAPFLNSAGNPLETLSSDP